MYKSNPDFARKVTIAKVDATANDVPEEIQGFPTIKLYKAGDKTNPVDYSGDRSIEDLADFVKDNGKYGIDVNAWVKENPGYLDSLNDGAAQVTGKAAEAATEAVKSVVSEATEVVKTMAQDTDGDHDEL